MDHSVYAVDDWAVHLQFLSQLGSSTAYTIHCLVSHAGSKNYFAA